MTDLLAGERSSDRQAMERQKARSYWEVGRQLTGVIPNSRGGKQAAYDKEVVRRLYDMLALFRAFPKLPASEALVWSHYRCLPRVSVWQLQLRIEEKTFELLREDGSPPALSVLPRWRVLAEGVVLAPGPAPDDPPTPTPLAPRSSGKGDEMR